MDSGSFRLKAGKLQKTQNDKEQYAITTTLDAKEKLPSFKQRLWHSTFGFHRFRLIMGSFLSLAFFVMLFGTLVDPTAPLYPAAFWLQNTLIPFIASLGLGAMAVPLVAVLGTLLCLTAPKWIGNLLQFVGDRLIASVINRITMIPYLIAREIGKALDIIDENGMSKTEFNAGIGTIIYTFIEGFFYLFPTVTYYAGKWLNYIGVLIAGEYNYNEIPNAVVSSHKRMEIMYDLAPPVDENLLMGRPFCGSVFPPEVFYDPKLGNSTESAKADPGMIWPEAGIKLSEFYNKGMNALAQKCPIPSLYEDEEVRHNGPAFKA